jgi:ubiquinone/menaquinone biosynthesis C-methylase UbiE
MAGIHSRARSFDSVAEAYERARPGWPAAAIDALVDRLGLDERSTVLDLAAGTGKLTRELVPRFATVIAVEPLDGMRAVLERVVPGARALAGTAEAIPLEDASVDAVVAGEAFHWFDPEPAVAEMARVLRPGGGVAALYNRDVQPRERWHEEIRMVFEAHRLPSDDIDPSDARPWTEALAARFPDLREDEFNHREVLGADDMITLFSSFSTIGGLPPARRDAALAALREALDRNGIAQAAFDYRTILTTARPT